MNGFDSVTSASATHLLRCNQSSKSFTPKSGKCATAPADHMTGWMAILNGVRASQRGRPEIYVRSPGKLDGDTNRLHLADLGLIVDGPSSTRSGRHSDTSLSLMGACDSNEND